MKKAEIAEFYRRLADRTPDPKTELDSINDYTLLVAVVLSAQATDAGVNLATRDLFAKVTTPAQMVALGEEGLKRHIKTIGLFNTKARNVIALSRALIERHGEQVPADRDALQKLPGVGRKTANVVMNVAFGAETFAVDTHVFRVANRTGLAKGKNVDQVETILDRQTPQPWRRSAHHLLILHGRYVCKARRPECWRCVVRDLCAFRPKTPPPEERLAGHGRDPISRSLSPRRSPMMDTPREETPSDELDQEQMEQGQAPIDEQASVKGNPPSTIQGSGDRRS